MVMAVVLSVKESSPRMRGALGSGRGRENRPRIIPAYAGNTSARNGARLCDGDHPRVCGEHRPVSGIPRRRAGSSPRMRGARVGGLRVAVEHGIIPAYAGSTLPKRRNYADFTSRNRPKNFSSNTLHLSSNLADYPSGRAATNRNRTPSHGQHHTCKPS